MIHVKNISALETRIGYSFKDSGLLSLSLCHASDIQSTGMSNERLEFLGDAVISAVISEHLFRCLPDQNEGQLSKLKSAAVNTSALASVCKRLELNTCACIGNSLSERSLPESVLANLYESLVAAVFLDGGYKAAADFIHSSMEDILHQLMDSGPSENYKSMLQNLTQKKNQKLPEYKTLTIQGEKHNREFAITVTVNGIEYGPGHGRSKKEAEQAAAKICLESTNVL